jgi:hypothetical protein
MRPLLNFSGKRRMNLREHVFQLDFWLFSARKGRVCTAITSFSGD